jgi:hypothetical protein
MAIDFTREVSELTPQEREAEFEEIRNHPDYKSTTGYGLQNQEKLVNRLQEHYKLKFPESEERASLQGGDQGLFDSIKKSGLESAEQIEEEAAHSRGEAIDSVIEQHMQTCENLLSTEYQWGSPGSPDYEKNLSIAEAIFDEFVIEEKDQDWVKHTPRNDPKAVALGNNPRFIELLRQVGEILVEHNTKYAEELDWFNRTWKPKKRK